MCIHEGCNKQPAFNIEGKKNGLYCSAHKLEGMIDVINKTCTHEGCNIRPFFNIEGKKTGLYCSAHKLEGMVNVISKTCTHEGCNTRANFNVEGKKNGLYCSAHKLEGMVDVIGKTCKSEWCFTRIGEKYNGYCQYCYINLFPNEPISRNYKTKEYAVIDYVRTNFPDLKWIADKIINGGCSRRRPDLLLDLLYTIIIIEIDENQHIDYDCSCENKRIMELSQDLGHRPIIFIRFNPDDYTKNGTTITSCWGYNKKGICTIKKSKQNEWDSRLESLKEEIMYWINPENITDKTIEIIPLFYDTHDSY